MKSEKWKVNVITRAIKEKYRSNGFPPNGKMMSNWCWWTMITYFRWRNKERSCLSGIVIKCHRNDSKRFKIKPVTFYCLYVFIVYAVSGGIMILLFIKRSFMNIKWTCAGISLFKLDAAPVLQNTFHAKLTLFCLLTKVVVFNNPSYRYW